MMKIVAARYRRTGRFVSLCLPMVSAIAIACSCAAVVRSESAGQTSRENDDQLISTQQLLEALNAQLQALDGLMIDVSGDSYYQRGSAEPPADDELAKHHVVERSARVLRCGHKYRIELAGRSVLPQWDHLKPRQSIYTNNGAIARTVTRIDGDEDMRNMEPDPMSHRLNTFHDLLGWHIQKWSAPISYVDVLQNWLEEGPLPGPDGQTLWRCVPVSKGQRSVTMEIELRATADPDVRLREVVVRSYREVGAVDSKARRLADGRLDVAVDVLDRITFSDERVMLNDEASISRRIDRVVNHFREKAEDSFWGVEYVRINDVSQAQINEDTFLEPIRTATASVADERLRLAYQLGSDRINIDGRLLRTHKPLEGDVIANLAWWIERGTYVELPGDPGEVNMHRDAR